MKGVFKFAMEDDETRSWSVKRSSLGMPTCTPNKYSRRLKRLSLGMPLCIPFFINNHQFVLLHTIFLLLHMICVCRDPGLAYASIATTQSYGEPRTVPTCLSRQGQAQNVLGKASNVRGIPSRPDDQLRWVLIVRTQV